jgi:hypothetical protein
MRRIYTQVMTSSSTNMLKFQTCDQPLYNMINDIYGQYVCAMENALRNVIVTHKVLLQMKYIME